MKRLSIILFLFYLLPLTGCKKRTETNACGNSDFTAEFTSRNFHMGFTTWPFGPAYADRVSTYSFINQNADIYSEQLDNYIPWKALINNQRLPKDLTDDIASRLSLKPANHKLLLSVSLLNIMRDNLLADVDGTLPAYTAINDTIIENAYSKYVSYLVDQFHPDYLVIGMEVNVLRIKQPTLWDGYLSLSADVTQKLKQAYPALKISASITLHDWYRPNVTNPDAYIKEMSDYVNAQDFVAISFYPFLKGLSTKSDFQLAFDFLHNQVQKPVAFVETSHIAENLLVPSFNISIPGTVCQQNDYVETLLKNARLHQYEFVIWWTHRDYDALWQTFPDSTKDIGKLWKDTGLEDEAGAERPGLQTWRTALGR